MCFLLFFLPFLFNSIFSPERRDKRGGCGALFSQGTWTLKAPLPAPGRWTSVAFTIGTKGYLGTGQDLGYYNDFWEYDPIANSWPQKANFLGSPRGAAVGFSIGNYGYIGAGLGVGLSLYNDFWKYDPIANTWTQIASVGGLPRAAAVGFSVAGKGYIGTGNSGVGYLQDLWEYDPVSNTWAQKANYVGGNRTDIDRAVFVICNKAYLGTGIGSGNIFYNDFWQYDPIVNLWTQKANFPGTQRVGATGFSIGSRGFLGLGVTNAAFVTDFYKYNPFTNSWSSIAAFPGAARFDAPVFVINNKAYLGTGRDNTLFYNDLWEYTPDSVIGGAVTAAIFSSSNTICSEASVTLSASGGSSYSWSNGSTNNTIIVSPTATTTYSVIVSDTTACGGSASAAVTISVTKVTASIACQNVCAGKSATLIASGGTNYLWSNGAITNSITVSPAAATSYSVIVSIGSCADTTNCTVNVFPAPVVTTNGVTQVSCNGGNDGSAVITVNGGTSPYMYNWSPTGGTNAGATGLNAGTYVITVTDAKGCSQVQTITISEPTFTHLAVPNAFSPNNDGENDFFCLQGDNYCIEELTITIYDRWGEKVFESNDSNFCWDGIFHGKMMNTAVFVYYFKTILISGEQITKKGNISLVR